MRFLHSLSMVALLTASGAIGQATTMLPDMPAAALPPALPWSGASERLIAAPEDPWITPAERAGFVTTPRYDETRAWLERLDTASPLITMETFGSSGEGRDLLMVRASKGGAAKPVVLIQAGIHSGEIDGKDAGLMLLRDIAMRGKHALLDRVDLVFVPIYNVDGHERMSRWNFPALRGPSEKGTIGNARNINLNRDYAKADAPETRAMIGLLRRLDPILYIDCHVSDGFDMQYDVTFTYAGWGRYAYHRATADWLMERFGPHVSKALAGAGHVPTIYPSPIDTRAPGKGIRQAPEGPRYSTGYGDFIAVPTVLVENHMLKPYRQRVLGTYVLMEAALKLAAQDRDRIQAAKARDRGSRPTTMLASWKPSPKPIGWIDDFKGIAFETYRSPASGRLEQRWTGKPISMRMPIMGQDPVTTVALPKAWWVPQEQAEVVDRLRLHGIRFDTLAAPRTMTLDRVRLRDATVQRAQDGRMPLKASFVHETVRRTLPAGTIRVESDQPLGLLAAALLEPEAPDSFLAWGFFPELLSAPSSAEDFVRAPTADALLASDGAIRSAFEAKLAAEPAFEADAQARLAWLLAHVPGDQGHAATYPILRETETDR
ncbi:murein tripeptide amidase MpaA [Novosphingobium chloroacetimidivorans]|uniref:Murein tripeptide amidase MpaA n=1 Tax=Novosphingobium chloroacetimidivorans TaxID=1428314 RepID=A0A7W7KAQ3_9SPHN|nr:M14 family metallopeptidase [Novosphingobium chloroacetimidivorans]MBB4858703.1 murein tripeptide amidase MpaA [Novosphingobium chloroacetimidivorans]